MCATAAFAAGAPALLRKEYCVAASASLSALNVGAKCVNVKSKSRKEGSSMKYELLYMSEPGLPEETQWSTVEHVLSLIKRSGGKPDDPDVWGERATAYEIQGHNKAYYVRVPFRGKKVDTEQLYTAVIKTETVMRAMVIDKEK